MKYLLVIFTLSLMACAQSGGGGGSASGATLAKALPNNAQDLTGTYKLKYLDCGEEQHSFNSTVGDFSYSDVITINGSSYSETEQNSDCEATYTGSISLGSSGISLPAFNIQSVTAGGCEIPKQNGAFIIFENFRLGDDFGQVSTDNYILDTTTLSIQTAKGQQFADINGWGSNCYMVYTIE